MLPASRRWFSASSPRLKKLHPVSPWWSFLLGLSGSPAESVFDGTSGWSVTPLFFRQTAARAPALESPERPFFDKGGAPMSDIRGSYTATLNVAHRKGLMVRQFSEKRMNEEKWKGWVGGRAPRGLYGPCRPQDGCERSASSGALPSNPLTTHQSPNPTFAKRRNPHPTAFYGTLVRSARQF